MSITIHHHEWRPPTVGTHPECRWCGCAKTPENMGATCGVVAHGWANTGEVVLSQDPEFNFSVKNKIAAIKALRAAIPSPFDNSLKATKTLIDSVFAGNTVRVRVDAPKALQDTLEEMGIRVKWGVLRPELSAHAQNVLDALRTKPSLLDELRAFIIWEHHNSRG